MKVFSLLVSGAVFAAPFPHHGDGGDHLRSMHHGDGDDHIFDWDVVFDDKHHGDGDDHMRNKRNAFDYDEYLANAGEECEEDLGQVVDYQAAQAAAPDRLDRGFDFTGYFSDQDNANSLGVSESGYDRDYEEWRKENCEEDASNGGAVDYDDRDDYDGGDSWPTERPDRLDYETTEEPDVVSEWTDYPTDEPGTTTQGVETVSMEGPCIVDQNDQGEFDDNYDNYDDDDQGRYNFEDLDSPNLKPAYVGTPDYLRSEYFDDKLDDINGDSNYQDNNGQDCVDDPSDY